MKILHRVLFTIAFVFLSVHSVRLIYAKFFEPRSSVLDPYEETVDVGIREAKSLDELVQQYDTAHRLVKDYEADESNPKIEYGERAQTEPYKSELRLREAIIEWETKSRIISETRLYWMFGLLFLAVGLAAYRWLNSLLTMSALIVAFSEMIYWSSPSYFSGFSQEFDRLLTNKLILALSSFLLLLIVAYVTKTFDPGGPSTQRAS